MNRVSVRTLFSLGGIALAAALAAAPAAAQTGSALDQWVRYPVTPVPFGPGEKLEYRITYGILGGVGSGSLLIAGVDSIRGMPAYNIQFRMKGGIPLARVDDSMQSWLDVQRLQSHRFEQDIDEPGMDRHRIIDFLPEQSLWRQVNLTKGTEDEGPLATDAPLDDISFLYYVRTLPLEVGQTYTLNRYYKNDGNPVTVKVLRRETVEVPAGKFDAIVVQPIIKTKGMFSEGGEAEVYFTDDERRLVVYMKTKLSIGTLKLHMTAYSPGGRLVPMPAQPNDTSK